jgi:hypothetical protein
MAVATGAAPSMQIGAAAAPVAVAAATPPPQTGAPAQVYQGLPQPQPAPPSHRFLVQSPLYRMEIGPVDTQEEANRALAQMIQSGYRDAHIVMN